MTRRTRRSSVAIRRGVLSLVLGVPLLSQPLQAQTSDVVGDTASDETSAEMVEMESEEMEAPAVETVQVGATTGSHIRGHDRRDCGTPRGGSPATVCLRRDASASWQPGDSR
jgi:hypothetical protein